MVKYRVLFNNTHTFVHIKKDEAILEPSLDVWRTQRHLAKKGMQEVEGSAPDCLNLTLPHPSSSQVFYLFYACRARVERVAPGVRQKATPASTTSSTCISTHSRQSVNGRIGSKPIDGFFVLRTMVMTQSLHPAATVQLVVVLVREPPFHYNRNHMIKKGP